MTRALVLLVAGCFHRETIDVMPSRIEAVQAQLRAGQHATIDNDIDVSPDQVVDLHTYGGKVTHVRLADLVRDCPPNDDKLSSQLCGRANIASVVLSDHRRFDLGRTVNATLLLTGVGLAGACVFACDSPANYLSGGVLVLAVVVVVADVVADAFKPWR